MYFQGAFHSLQDQADKRHHTFLLVQTFETMQAYLSGFMTLICFVFLVGHVLKQLEVDQSQLMETFAAWEAVLHLQTYCLTFQSRLDFRSFSEGHPSLARSHQPWLLRLQE